MAPCSQALGGPVSRFQTRGPSVARATRSLGPPHPSCWGPRLWPPEVEALTGLSGDPCPDQHGIGHLGACAQGAPASSCGDHRPCRVTGLSQSPVSCYPGLAGSQNGALGPGPHRGMSGGAWHGDGAGQDRRPGRAPGWGRLAAGLWGTGLKAEAGPGAVSTAVSRKPGTSRGDWQGRG